MKFDKQGAAGVPGSKGLPGAPGMKVCIMDYCILSLMYQASCPSIRGNLDRKDYQVSQDNQVNLASLVLKDHLD